MYRKIQLDEPIKIDYVYTIHYYKYAKNFSYKGEKHNFWELVYVDSGEVGIIADNHRYTLSQGEILFHKPNEYHSIWAANKFANVVVMSFECSSPAMRFFENKILFLNQKTTHLLSDIITEAKSAFAEPLNIVELPKMTERKDIPFAAKQLIKLRLEELLIRLIRSNNTIMTKERIVSYSRESRNQELAQNINDYLKENVHGIVTLDMVSTRFSFSKTYIKRIYKDVTGVSIIDYFITLKIEEAKKMISENDYNISEIAEMLAFNSVHYFSRCFKSRTNMTPSEYARSVQSKNML